MKFSIADCLDDSGEYNLEIDINNIGEDDHRNELIPQLIMTTMRTINEYIQTIPANNSYERDEDGCISTNDLNECLNDFKTEHLDKFLNILKNNIEETEFSD